MLWQTCKKNKYVFSHARILNGQIREHEWHLFASVEEVLCHGDLSLSETKGQFLTVLGCKLNVMGLIHFHLEMVL